MSSEDVLTDLIADRQACHEVEQPDWFFLNSDPANWSYLIPDELQQLWPRLSKETKLAVYIVAKRGADQLNYY
jgi:hypothetical protein